MKYNVVWINTFSGESGFVKRVMYHTGHFVNTFDKKEAKKYKSKNAAKEDIERLIEMGEGRVNDFVPVEIEE